MHKFKVLKTHSVRVFKINIYSDSGINFALQHLPMGGVDLIPTWKY